MTDQRDRNVSLIRTGEKTWQPVVLVSTSEITLKSSYVRGTLLRTLIEHLRWKLRRSAYTDFEISIDTGRIVVAGLSDSRASQICAQVFGVAATTIGFRVSGDTNSVAKRACEYARRVLVKGDSFAVRVRVAGPYPESSREIERRVGSEILAELGERSIKVDLEHPKKTIHLEIRGDSLYLYERRVQGYGGLPYGSQGRLVGILTEDARSFVASWLMMKRGSHIIPVLMNPVSDDVENLDQKMLEMTKRIREFAPVEDYRLITVPYRNVVEAVSSVEEECRWVIEQRTKYRLGSLIARKVHALGIVTGERLQRDSKELANLPITNEIACVPVHRPLAGLNEEEIQIFARRIDIGRFLTCEKESMHKDPVKPRPVDLRRIRVIEEDLQLDRLVQGIMKRVIKIDLKSGSEGFLLFPDLCSDS